MMPIKKSKINNNGGGESTGAQGVTPQPLAKRQKVDDESLLNSVYINCAKCNENQPLERFYTIERQKGSNYAICQLCLTRPNTNIPPGNNITKICATCHSNKTKEGYTKSMWKRRDDLNRRKCRVCQENVATLSRPPKENTLQKDPPVDENDDTILRSCITCGIVKSKEEYSPTFWNMAAKRSCLDCEAIVVAENKRLQEESRKLRNENKRLKKEKERALKEATILRACTTCGIEKYKAGFSSQYWMKTKIRRCFDCETKHLCTTCNLTKPKSYFSKHQWRHPIHFSKHQWRHTICDSEKTRMCLLCLPKEKEEEAIRQEKEAIRLAKIKNGVQHAFELFQEYDSVYYNFDKAEFSFAEPTSYINLVGTYDIIFSAGYSTEEESDTQRTCNGTLTLAANKNLDNDEQNGIRVNGDVKMGNNCKDPDNSVFGVDFTMEQLEINRDSYEFVVGGRFAEHRNEEVKATVKEIKSRVGFPWWDPLSGIGITNAQATALFGSQLHASTNYDKSWIVNHLPITNSDIAKKIHEYATPWTPEPVFYVEPGDLWIEVVWDMSFRDFSDETYLIARRRVEST